MVLCAFFQLAIIGHKMEVSARPFLEMMTPSMFYIELKVLPTEWGARKPDAIPSRETNKGVILNDKRLKEIWL